MENDEDSLDFSMVLASAVHDMKNSLSLLISAIQSLEPNIPNANEHQTKQLAILQYESARLNSSLVQLLGLYKIESEQLPVNLNYYDMDDFLSEQAAQYQTLLDSKGIQLEVDVEDELDGVFDSDLVASVINNILGNAIRYSQSKIRLSAFYDDGIVIEIADDGSGYPARMIESQENFIKSINHSTGSTGLGLYFAGQIALLHRQDDKHGSIQLSNGGPFGGGVFRLKLP